MSIQFQFAFKFIFAFICLLFGCFFVKCCCVTFLHSILVRPLCFSSCNAAVQLQPLSAVSCYLQSRPVHTVMQGTSNLLASSVVSKLVHVKAVTTLYSGHDNLHRKMGTSGNARKETAMEWHQCARTHGFLVASCSLKKYQP